MVRRWTTEIGRQCFFYDDAVIDSDVDSNLFGGGVRGNKGKQKYFYDLNWITQIKMD